MHGGQCVIGRVARRSDLVIVDQAVSGEHVRISEEAGELTIEDLQSRNGTYLDAERLVPGKRYPLRLDQPVYIGASLLLVTMEQSWEVTRIGAPAYKPKFVGVLYTDMVQSTAMTARLGQDRALALLEWHNQTLRDRFKKFGGRETKFTGDGFEAIFSSVSDALSCAASCQRALARRNHEDSTGLALEVRMGINGGEAPASGRRVYGMPLILSARVMNQAKAGQILVTSHVPGIVAGSLWRFTSVGMHSLKGLDRPVELFEVDWHDDPNLKASADLINAVKLNGQAPAPQGGRRQPIPTAPIE
jgi:class 3 adenylate cyclase